MRHPTEIQHQPEVTVDDVEFKSLYRKELYEVQTADRWTLVITRYRPIPQAFPQPIFGEPILLVHGFSQNRHAWTSGQFVKNLLFFGADIHIIEVRGHGKSSIELQQRKSLEEGTKPPDDLDYGWDLDSYFLYDIPAAVAGVKRRTDREKIFYCGHSMGGMLGYGYAGIHDDLEGLITIGAPSELGKGFLALKLLALAGPAFGHGIDALFAGINTERRAFHALSKKTAASLRALRLGDLASRVDASGPGPSALKYRFVPVDDALRALAQLLTPETYAAYEKVSPYVTFLANPARMTSDDVRWLLREGGEREPRGVIEQFAKWIRRGELTCYRTGYDFKRNFSKIEIPMAIIFGDLDKLASVRSTAAVYRAARSEYLLWRPVKGNSHIELTMGHDIRQISYDVKNLIDFAIRHRGRKPSLPRLPRPDSVRR